jgi:2-polyprenyl-3-methyl-5-hydroxy-6-metoxy-1,4-benzoquinol methylase
MAAPMQESRRAARADAYENPRAERKGHVPAGARRVLDLGCASGALGAALKARGATVVGVERDPAYAALARECLDEVVEADLETFDPAPLGTFDVLVAGDVLEHLADPWSVLRRFAAVVEPGGTVVVSLPNVRHWESVFAIAVRGRFPRRNEGVFDGTHLRWFTLHDAWSLVDQAGLTVEAVERRIRYRRVGGAKETAAARLIARVPGPRAFLTYQHVIRARKPA